MIILDTNVFSEPTKPKANPRVLSWFDKRDRRSLYLTSINLAELLEGIAIMPDSKRKVVLRSELGRQLNALIVTPILPFDARAAFVYADLVAYAKSKRYTLPIADGQIAAIAKLYGYTVATRDTAPFIAASVAVVNPWEE